jgi:hypothetical protein
MFEGATLSLPFLIVIETHTKKGRKQKIVSQAMIIDNKRNLKKPRTVRANVQTYGLKGGNQNDNQNQIKIKLNKTKTEKKKKEKQSRDSP